MHDAELLRASRWLSEQEIPFHGPARAALIGDGRSNLTYRVEDTTGRAYILRRPPAGSALPQAHDVEREFSVLTSLQGSQVPVPELFGLCTDPSVIGAPFYVMEYVAGTVLTTNDDGASYPVSARAAAAESLVDSLGAIHELDVDAIGLGRLGRREDYLPRQLARWRRQFHSVSDRPLPIIDEVWSRLSATTPPQRYTGLVHGDFRFGNLLLGEDGRTHAVLDWELCALGDTLSDLGWLTALWREAGEPEVSTSPTGHPGYPTRNEVIALYEARTGRDVSDIEWYQAFALWRLACIGEGIYVRYRDGAMGASEFDVVAQRDHVVDLAEAAARRLPRKGITPRS
ncbi:phosphotransferase family protein [Rhodococcus sp. KBS0724]|uniref:phosphotransferase family protein n=1 Tax=Rhodococcus sp. KBS0724 TaxID=1179674 RepID=UPI00110E7DF2|nr:phosphotransferase family protein [Rhodococcus sp. KBS0724]TSD40345.1 phosphotransferase family protein [Rhodococcus sp. KBS0724]